MDRYTILEAVTGDSPNPWSSDDDDDDTLPISDAAFCICGFRMILSVNTDYFLKQR
jgi:hypothetical protein